MFEVYALLFVVTLLAVISETYTDRVLNSNGITVSTDIRGKICLFVAIAILIWFAGTRTRMNDTFTYIISFKSRIPSGIASLGQIKWELGANPLFFVYQVLIKTFVSNNPHVFILITSGIVVYSMVKFLYRNSWNFGESIYFFLTFTVYGFTMAAIKQTMATAIAIWIIPCIQEKKYIKMLFILTIAIHIHPYVVILIVAVIIYDKGLWNKYIYTIIIATFLIGITFSSFTEIIFRLTELIGQDYEENWDIASTGVSVARVLAYTIVPGLSLLFRDEIEELNNPLFDLSINMSIVAMCLSIISWFGGAVLFGRLPAYFGIFICIALPYILQLANRKYGNILSLFIFAAFLYYYMTYYTKFFNGYGVGLWDSVYNRVSLLSILMGESL